ncbi:MULTISPECIES: hypothetical protein [Mycobacterium]|uniref:Uncharacterized protein n=1 Tax=Mycobacterium kiyosense TaxID=2871094 RepID=A0A9P3Q8W2_9MYCO|nr:MULTISPECIES: hypothetical protein [Mycobacterium]BDB40144.1 hypothetical protein IWGMT90018_05900 [Mycobacterium kiyosense]BDE11979.1 hypothetical protein MKCMC460_08390 [Mycobacterium sp. 20KCMC460]GLB85192.1 hypothetical protein SRL2020028_44480 [Mycobacterium kiyosense]GLB92513.1 hypothetical protein SRL2020130_53300 [Mycobacterium kiyosense]GLB98727.1 hypothetical protein SRL2020226_55030 [Mycobacterium kiyosense]
MTRCRKKVALMVPVLAWGATLAASAAHAAGNCTVAGPQLQMHQSTGYDVTVDANGAALGPTAVVSTAEQTSPGSITGGIEGRTVDFVVTFAGTKAYVHFTGTVSNDGTAHGTSSGTAVPLKLDAGSWDSTTRFTC